MLGVKVFWTDVLCDNYYVNGTGPIGSTRINISLKKCNSGVVNRCIIFSASCSTMLSFTTEPTVLMKNTTSLFEGSLFHEAQNVSTFTSDISNLLKHLLAQSDIFKMKDLFLVESLPFFPPVQELSCLSEGNCRQCINLYPCNHGSPTFFKCCV